MTAIKMDGIDSILAAAFTPEEIAEHRRAVQFGMQSTLVIAVIVPAHLCFSCGSGAEIVWCVVCATEICLQCEVANEFGHVCRQCIEAYDDIETQRLKPDKVHPEDLRHKEPRT